MWYHFSVYFSIVTEAFTNIGEDINVPLSVQLTISCGHLIDPSVYNITWRHNGHRVANNSALNLTISQDKHRLILAPTSITSKGSLGNEGLYACTVCSSNGTCTEKQSRCMICGKPLSYVELTVFNCIIVEAPRLLKAATPITKISTKVFSFSHLQCDESLCIDSGLPMNVLTFHCFVQNYFSESVYELNIYKDDAFYVNGGTFLINETIVPNSLGTYKTVLNNSCGIDTAISVLSLCGKFVYVAVIAYYTKFKARM